MIPIEELVQPSDLDLATGDNVPQNQKVQTLVSQIRTDLDAFSLEEICALVRHGYEVALKRVRATASLPGVPEPG